MYRFHEICAKHFDAFIDIKIIIFTIFSKIGHFGCLFRNTLFSGLQVDDEDFSTLQTRLEEKKEPESEAPATAAPQVRASFMVT